MWDFDQVILVCSGQKKILCWKNPKSIRKVRVMEGNKPLFKLKYYKT
jgi:hypothetical protein